jgi:RHS repeat-associated protein
MQMDSRTVNDGDYRYGFNGKEKDQNEEFGNTHYDFGARIYNPGYARFMSMDKYTSKFSFQSPYSYAGNTPIAGIDVHGDSLVFLPTTFATELQDRIITLRNENEVFNKLMTSLEEAQEILLCAN